MERESVPSLSADFASGPQGESAWALVQALIEASEAREPLARGHAARVSFYAGLIGRALGLNADQVRALEVTGLLHDVGKIGVSDSILRNAHALKPEEALLYMEHAVIGASILEKHPSLQVLAPLVRCHHEWYAGGGFPDGLAGESIPVGARIIAIADAFDLLTMVSPFGGPRPWQEALRRLKELAGRQFWPQGVEALCQQVEEDARAGKEYLRSLTGSVYEPPGIVTASNIPINTAGEWRLWETGVGPLAPAHTKSLVILYRVATAVGAVLNLPQMLQNVVEIIQQELGYADVAVVLLEPAQGHLTVAAGGGAYRSLEGFRFPSNEGLSGQALRQGSMVYVPDVSRSAEYLPLTNRTRAEAVIPLIVEGQPTGVLVVDSPQVAGIKPDDLQALRLVSNELATAIAAARKYQDAATASTVDGLTQLYNHRYFYDRLEQEIARASRYNHPLQVAILDLDGLKPVNDRFGHLTGDQALRMIAQTLRANTRSSDVLARYGGDEFAIIFPETSREGAWRTLCRIGDALEHGSLEVNGTT
ncbi:MAG: diguanylate cyclase [Limnochordales bacterium]|nr:diguanylate cyclase [Limnochordales bacterium]